MRAVRDILMFLISGAGILAIALFVATVDTLPMWMLLGAAVILWVIFLFLSIRDFRRHPEPTLFYSVNGEWIAADGSGRRIPMTRTATAELFDQDEFDTNPTATRTLNIIKEDA